MRLVNAGSVGMPYEGTPSAHWLLLDERGVELVSTPYDSEAAYELLEAKERPAFEWFARPLRGGSPPRRRRPPSRVAAVARSYVSEARRRGLGRRRDRIGPIVERLAQEHADATIALRFRSDVGSLSR